MIHIPTQVEHAKDSSFLRKDGLSSQAFECPAGSHQASAHDLHDSVQASKVVTCEVDGMSKLKIPKTLRERRTFG